jgi:hypothetical protein
MKKHNIFTLFVTSLSVFLFCLCTHPNTYNFPDDEHWVYKNGDTLIYSNNLGLMDSFLVYNLKEGYRTGVTSYEDEDRYEEQEYKLGEVNKLTDTYIIIDRYMMSYKLSDYSRVEFHDSTKMGYGFYAVVGDASKGEADTLYNNLAIANKDYKNVYYYSLNSSTQARHKIYFNHTYGLLQYDYNNQTWRLSEIKPER